MPKPPIRLGIAGCGRATREHHLPALASVPEFTVVAVADTDAKRVEEVATRFSIPARFHSCRELLERGGVDAVAVATPTPSHADLGVDVLRAGKHLFMEKPLAMTTAECDRLVGAAAGGGTAALVAHNSRWHRLASRARDVVRAGTLGGIRAIRSVYTHAHHNPGEKHWHTTRAAGGGVTFNDGVHHFDLWRYLLDTDIVQVHCDSIESAAFEDDTSTVSARLANGTLASAVFSFSTSANSEIEIFGERGSLLLSLYRFDGLEVVPYGSLPGSAATRIRNAVNSVRSLPGGLAALRRGGEFDATYVSMWRHFAGCILRGGTPACTLEDGRAAVATAAACVESARSGRTMAV